MQYPVFSHETRAEWLARLRTSDKPVVFDAVVIGGGIVGASVARELAIRGIKTLVVEKNDFASGTSSRSSKLIHGGLRYLEMLDFHLVFESLAERHWLLKTHPHLVQPLEFNLPVFTRGQGPAGSRGGFELGVGLWLYDALSLFRTPFFHGRRTPDELGTLFPGLVEQGLKCGYYYADAMMLDDELVLETVLDSVRRGTSALNYVKVADVGSRGADGLYTIGLEDQLGAREPIAVKARETVVCVGPWTEQFGAHVAEGAGHRLKPSRGVHLILPWSRLPVERCLVMYHPDGRIVFAIPRKDLGPGAECVIIGTTDAPESGDLDAIRAQKDDVSYLLHVLGEYFPAARITEQDILVTYAGVRPLLDSGAASEAKTSREHEIWRNKAGVVFMAGGKYTTFRRIADEIATFAFPSSRTSQAARESKAAISSPEDYAERLAGHRIWGRYTDNWVRWKLAHSSPCTLTDLAFRRLPLWMGGTQAFGGALDQVGEIARSAFGWTDARLKDERAAAVSELDSRRTWR